MKLSLSRASAVLILSLSTALVSCANVEQPITETSSAQDLYLRAKQSLRQGDFLTAVSMFELLGARYPFGNYTQQAQLDISYAYLKQNEFDNAIASADRFIKLYPRSEQIDYAYYIKGLANYSRGSSAMERLFPRDVAKVDQNWPRAAYADFDSLIRRFPNSEYSPDARERMAYLRDKMAEHELLTARFYYNRSAMVASINRVNYLLEHFNGSQHVPDALALMAQAYDVLGEEQLREDTLRVLALTDPEHPAIQPK